MARYLITEGDPETGYVDDIECSVREEELEGTLRALAERVLSEGGDVGSIRVWKLTEVVVTSTGFSIGGLEKVLGPKVGSS